MISEKHPKYFLGTKYEVQVLYMPTMKIDLLNQQKKKSSFINFYYFSERYDKTELFCYFTVFG